MPRRLLGEAQLKVSALGLDVGVLSGATFSDPTGDALIGAALDAGVTLIDTGGCHRRCEDRLGRLLDGRRQRVVLSARRDCLEGVHHFTGVAVERAVEEALGRLRTDWLDLFVLQGASPERLLQGDLQHALERAQQAGKIRSFGYCGEREGLLVAANDPRFAVLACPVEMLERPGTRALLATAVGRGAALIAEERGGTSGWRWQLRARGEGDHRWQRIRALAPEADMAGVCWPELSLRHAADTPGVASVLIRATTPSELEESVRWLDRGPLPWAVREAMHKLVADTEEPRPTASYRALVRLMAG